LFLTSKNETKNKIINFLEWVDYNQYFSLKVVNMFILFVLNIWIRIDIIPIIRLSDIYIEFSSMDMSNILNNHILNSNITFIYNKIVKINDMNLFDS
jgi:hypothetical protein